MERRAGVAFGAGRRDRLLRAAAARAGGRLVGGVGHPGRRDRRDSLGAGAMADLVAATRRGGRRGRSSSRDDHGGSPGRRFGERGSKRQRSDAAAASNRFEDSSLGAITWARAFWANFWDGLGERPAAEPAVAWRWPGTVAWVLLAGMALALARLMLGLLAVGRYRRRTRPVTDPGLIALLNAMRERLGCHRAIELRESAEIHSPATVGWRRPLILLPPRWREWSDAERQVVLAHEVAHVRRGDFAAWLVAQFSVALHFYNPLVHWLARQLRIEQELAADAWGAAAAGGSVPYLVTLAGMALQQDNRTTNWAARPFLPARGTLLRRIEMLRDKKQPRSFTFSMPKQIVVWSALIALGLFIAGLRGPQGTQSLAQAAPPAASGAGETPGATGAVAQPIDLDFVPADATLVVAIRPGDFFQSDAGKLLAKAAGSTWTESEKKLGLPISEIEHVTFIVTGFLDQPSRIILRATKPHDWTKFAASIVPDAVEVGAPADLGSSDPAQAALAKKRYFKPRNPKGSAVHSYGPAKNPPFCYFLPDDRTVVFAPESEMTPLIVETIKPQPKPTWADLWQRVATGKVAVMLDVEKLRKQIEPELKQAPMAAMLAMIGPLWQDSQRLLIGTDLSDKKLGLLALDQCPSEEAAARVERTCEALLTMASNGLAQVRKIDAGGPADVVAIKKTLMGAAEELVKQARVSREGSSVVLKSEGSGATLLAAASVAMPAIGKSREAAKRVQGMNNMKQLALAMMIYCSAHNHLPPAVVMGPDGKTLHSWRVELLPYLDEVKLYDQYKMNEPWDSPANKKVLAAAPAVFHSPFDASPSTDASYFVLTGKGTMFSGKEGIKIENITGGMSQTLMIVEAKRDIPWTKPEDIDYDPAKPLPKLGGVFTDGFGVAFADGSVHFIHNTVKEGILRALINPLAEGKLKLQQNLEPLDASLK
jgi:beta-lactamase regulating signal transducer with metallopeptidase domain